MSHGKGRKWADNIRKWGDEEDTLVEEEGSDRRLDKTS
jgi:hypothetical protein